MRCAAVDSSAPTSSRTGSAAPTTVVPAAWHNERSPVSGSRNSPARARTVTTGPAVKVRAAWARKAERPPPGSPVTTQAPPPRSRSDNAASTCRCGPGRYRGETRPRGVCPVIPPTLLTRKEAWKSCVRTCCPGLQGRPPALSGRVGGERSVPTHTARGCGRCSGTTPAAAAVTGDRRRVTDGRSIDGYAHPVSRCAGSCPGTPRSSGSAAAAGTGTARSGCRCR